MGPITKEQLASNPFRTLALSGSAVPSAIEEAARRMRIFPNPSHLPPTPWDLPGLGPVRRARPDIEHAVALLNEPVSRLEHRLLWFCGERLPTTVTDPATASVADRHAQAIADLYAAWARGDNDDGWSAVVRQIVEVHASTDLLPWVRQVEQAGQFEKPASDEEIAAIVTSLPTAVAAGLIPRAMTALEHRRIDTVTAIASAVRLVPASPGANGPFRDLLNRMEDFSTARCSEMEKDLRDHLSIVRDSPQQSYPGNLESSNRANDFYLHNVLPAMSALLKLADDDDDRLIRLRTRCGELLVLLALGWEWSGKFVVAEQQLQNALKVAQGTLTEAEVRRELARVGLLADAEREQIARGLTVPKPAFAGSGNRIVDYRNTIPPAHLLKKKKRSWPAGVGIAVGAIWLMRLVISAAFHFSSTPFLPPLPTVPPIRSRPLSSQLPPQVQTPPDPASIANPIPADPPKQSVGDAFRER